MKEREREKNCFSRTGSRRSWSSRWWRCNRIATFARTRRARRVMLLLWVRVGKVASRTWSLVLVQTLLLLLRRTWSESLLLSSLSSHTVGQILVRSFFSSSFLLSEFYYCFCFCCFSSLRFPSLLLFTSPLRFPLPSYRAYRCQRGSMLILWIRACAAELREAAQTAAATSKEEEQ